MAKLWLQWLLLGVSVAALTTFVLAIAAHQPLSWPLCGAAFCFGLTIPLSLAFTIGFSIHDALDVEPGIRENTLTNCLALVVALPTLLGSLFLICHLSIDAGILCVVLGALVALITYFWPKYFRCELHTPRRGRKRSNVAEPMKPLPRRVFPRLLRPRKVS